MEAHELRATQAFVPCGREVLGIEGDVQEEYLLFTRRSVSVRDRTPLDEKVEQEEEIYWSGPNLVWSANNVVKNRFRFEEKVLNACWCRFRDLPGFQDGNSAREDSWLCALCAGGALYAYSDDGEDLEVMLPENTTRIWSLECGGLLIEFENSSFWKYLAHPLDELEDVDIPSGNGCAGHRQQGMEGLSRVVWCDTKVPLLLAFDSLNKRHHLFQIRHSSTQILQPEKGLGRTIHLDCIWGTPGADCGAARSVFFSESIGNELILCILLRDEETLHALHLEDMLINGHAWRILSTTSIEAIAAVSVVASRPPPLRDILLISPQGGLSLYVGDRKLCDCVLCVSTQERKDEGHVEQLTQTFESILTGMEIDRPPEQLQEGFTDIVCFRDEKVVDIRDGLLQKATLITSNRTKYRCMFNGFTPVSPLTVMALDLFSFILPEDDYFDLWKHCVNMLATDGHREWDKFCKLVISWLQAEEMEMDCKSSDIAQNSPWDQLLASDYHRTQAGLYTHIVPLLSSDATGHPSIVAKASFQPWKARTILEGMHALYEDAKMDTLHWDLCKPIARFCVKLASLLQETNYVDYYARDLDDMSIIVSAHKGSRAQMHPADLYKVLMQLLCRGDKRAATKGMPPLLLGQPPSCLHWSRDLLVFFEILNEEGEGGHERLLLEMVSRGWGLAELERVPPGIVIPLHEAVRYCRASPPSSWPAAAYALASREDLAAMASISNGQEDGSLGMLHALPCSLSFLSAKSQALYEGILKSQAATLKNQAQQAKGTELNTDISGTEDLQGGVFFRRFPNDVRLQEVSKLLESSAPRPIILKEDYLVASGDPDIVSAQQSKLWAMASRTSSLSVGRGALTLSSYRNPDFDLGESMPIPELCLGGTLPQHRGAVVALDFSSMGGSSSELAQQYLAWPEFHNGVAAGLRLFRHGGKLTRSWIEYNRPKTESSSHGGFMLSLGLQGHLKSLKTSDIFLYLSKEHELTTVGVLLGLGAAHRGSMDEHISKVLFLHVPSQHPSGYPELELSTHVQSVAILSAGLLYEGSCQRLVSAIFLEEIGRKASESSEPMRPAVSGGSQESYALAAGFALGLVLLGKGRSAHNVADLRIEDRLLHFMNGGLEFPRWPQDGLEQDLGFSRKLPREISPDDLKMVHGAESSQGTTGLASNGLVMDDKLVNTHVTAPAAMMALALIFLKTNDKGMASQFQIPSTLFAMDYVRPDFILLRVVAKNLIMWDSIHPTRDWMDAQVPPLLRHILDDEIILPDDVEDQIVDVEQLALAYINTLAGVALSIGLRFAGTRDPEASQELQGLVTFMSNLRKSANAVPSLSSSITLSSPPSERLDKASVEVCLDVCALGLGLVMAGSGDLKTLQVLRPLLRRLEGGTANLTYGNHMAISMAIGFLFMGGGTHTFGTSNQAVASLLISLFPVFPYDTLDNRCHLQALRHLYVLAAEHRCVEAIDVDTQQPVFVPVEVGLKHWDNSIVKRMEVAPFLLPEIDSVQYIKVCGPRYWEQLLVSMTKDGASSSLLKSLYLHGKVYVKRRVEVLPYSLDPTGSGTKLSSMLEKSNPEDTLELVRLFATDPGICTFAEELCKGEGEVPQHHRRFLHECICEEKLSALSLYVFFYSMFRQEGALSMSFRTMDAPASTLMWSLRFVVGYYERYCSSAPQLVHVSFLRALWQNVEERIQTLGFEKQQVGALAKYLRGERLEDMPLFGAYLQACEIPFPSQLPSIPNGESLVLLATKLPDVDVEAVVRLARATAREI